MARKPAAPKPYHDRSRTLPERIRLWAGVNFGPAYVDRATEDMLAAFSEGIPAGHKGAFYRSAFSAIFPEV